MANNINMQKNNISSYYRTDRAAKVIYGAILIFAFLISQDSHSNVTALSAATSTFFAAFAIVLAEIYAEILGKTIKQKKPLTKNQRIEIEQDSLAIISISLWPIIFFMASWAGLFGLQTAFNLSYGFYILILFGFSYWASMLSGNSKVKALITTSIISLLGLIVVLVKYFLGH